jgi:hypothetical protein
MFPAAARTLMLCTVLPTIAGVGLPAAQVNQQQSDVSAAPTTAAAEAAAETASAIPMQQLESLLAPIALYPDDLLAQTLVASTYPLEIVQLQQWLLKHKNLEGQALMDTVATQDWDPSIQSMAAVPEVVERLANDIQWTTELGNAFLAQQGDVMVAAQSMRRKAQNNGALANNEQQKVEVTVVEKDTIIVVVNSNPDVIYVPSYNPTTVYGPPLYPYPPIYYPYYPPGAPFISFSVGIMWGAAWGGSCCGCGWGGNDIYINNENNFNRVSHHGDRDGKRGNRGDRGDRGGDQVANRDGQGTDRAGDRGGKSTWQHDSKHRGAAPYGDRATAQKFGGETRSDRAAATNRTSAGASNRADRAAPGASQHGGRDSGVGNRAQTGRAGGSPSASTRSGSDRIGDRSIPSGGSRNQSGFSSGSRGYSGPSARASGSRGSASRGGGGRGGGSRR